MRPQDLELLQPSSSSKPIEESLTLHVDLAEFSDEFVMGASDVRLWLRLEAFLPVLGDGPDSTDPGAMILFLFFWLSTSARTLSTQRRKFMYRTVGRAQTLVHNMVQTPRTG
jgi:hypothetical protein